MKNDKLTEKKFWDDYWDEYSLPSEIKKTQKNYYLNEILNIFDKYLPQNSILTALEIGGSPGQYLAYLYKNFSYKVHCLDYSETGCIKTEENFRL
jgi:hypothetical protein